jgi:hypothetical protein
MASLWEDDEDDIGKLDINTGMWGEETLRC